MLIQHQVGEVGDMVLLQVEEAEVVVLLQVAEAEVAEEAVQRLVEGVEVEDLLRYMKEEEVEVGVGEEVQNWRLNVLEWAEALWNQRGKGEGEEAEVEAGEKEANPGTLIVESEQ